MAVLYRRKNGACDGDYPAKTNGYHDLLSGPEMTPAEVSRAYKFAMENGAVGICIFHDYSMAREHRDFLSRFLQKG